jgi:hypothetical protein
MGFSPVWDFHLYGIFTCMGFSPVWDFHLYGIFTCMGFSPVWLFHLYGFFTCMRFFAYGVFLRMWILRMGFARGFSSVGFSFLRSMRAEYAGGVCERSMLTKHF